MSGRDALLARRQQLLQQLPPLHELLRGSFFVRHRRCGKPSCHCARGPGHRIAVVGVTFAGGATAQIAVAHDLESVARRWVRNYQRCWNTLERISTINRQLLQRRLVGPDR